MPQDIDKLLARLAGAVEKLSKAVAENTKSNLALNASIKRMAEAHEPKEEVLEEGEIEWSAEVAKDVVQESHSE